VGRTEDLILLAGQKPVGECLKGSEGVGAGVHISHAVSLCSHDKHVEPLASFAKGEALGAGYLNVVQCAKVRASRRHFGQPSFAALLIAKIF